jgi:hypothetical protein
VSSVAIPSSRELVLGRYRPVRPLGSGGSGSVWLAQDDVTGLDVALKIIPREGKAAARAEREALAARRIRHERCVRAYDVGHDASHVYIAYEYVPGRTVREAMRADELSDADAIEIATQILDALAHAHRAGIVHRDVKPSNVLLEDDVEVAARLLDFGLAQFDGADTLTGVGDVPGTLAYIAPERLAGKDASPESDVWAVGVLLWETLAGRHPFWGMPLNEVASAIERGAPPLATERRDLPHRLLAAVDGALALAPQDRPRASSLAAELRAAGRRPESRAAGRKSPATPAPRPKVPALVPRLAAGALAASGALLGATLLPFWPALLVAAIVVGAGAAAYLHPRLGLAVALAAPLFPLGNLAEGAAVLYGILALAWVVLTWSDARGGLLFLIGPLLAPLGLLALVPLAVQPVRGVARRAAVAGTAILSAAVVAGLSHEKLPLAAGETAAIGVSPLDSPPEIWTGLLQAVIGEPLLLASTVVAASAAAVLPLAHRLSQYGVLALGAALLVGAVVSGMSLAAVPVVALVWGIAGAVAAGSRR